MSKRPPSRSVKAKGVPPALSAQCRRVPEHISHVDLYTPLERARDYAGLPDAPVPQYAPERPVHYQPRPVQVPLSEAAEHARAVCNMRGWLKKRNLAIHHIEPRQPGLLHIEPKPEPVQTAPRIHERAKRAKLEAVESAKTLQATARRALDHAQFLTREADAAMARALSLPE